VGEVGSGPCAEALMGRGGEANGAKGVGEASLGRGGSGRGPCANGATGARSLEHK